MKAERLAEIRKRWSNGPNPMDDPPENEISDWLDMGDCLDHIAQLDERVSTLLFTNGVLDSAAKDAQAWLCRAQTAEAKCAQLEAQRGGAVVVPELTDEEISARFWANIPDSDETWYKWALRDYRWAYYLAISRIQPIPADRVLADGMVGVDREAIKTAIGLVRCLVIGPGSGQDALSAMESALRSAKGEVEG